MSKKVVVTGLGIVSPIGNGIDAFWKAALNGASGVKEISCFDASKYKSRIAAEVQGYNAREYFPNANLDRMDRFAHFCIGATKMALDDSGLDLNAKDPYQVGVSIGSGMGGMLMAERQITALHDSGRPEKVNPNSIPMVTLNAASGQIAILLGVKGPNITTSTACSSSAHSIGQAADLIKLGKADVMIAGGADACITPLAMAGFCSLRTLSTRNDEPKKAMRPFDKLRDGFVMGEGAGVLILESLEHAQKRKAKIYAEVAGYGSTSEASHMVIPEQTGKEMVKTMELAMDDANVSGTEVDYINAHATSTPIGDPVEIKAIQMLFKEHANKIVINATKALVGHTIGAAGAIAAIVCALSIKEGAIHPNLNYDDPDPLCEMEMIKGTVVEKNLRIALVNSFGFGSNNSTLILRKFENA
ncbi:MAG TPA: beta-ketoacyl-ACP synthase II [Nitrospinota bacterium]|nr:beta-ketoacyl-ACP synthase II [Nitrospinota bacterium]